MGNLEKPQGLLLSDIKDYNPNTLEVAYIASLNPRLSRDTNSKQIKQITKYLKGPKILKFLFWASILTTFSQNVSTSRQNIKFGSSHSSL